MQPQLEKSDKLSVNQVNNSQPALPGESIYRAILEASPDDITITDLEGKVLMTSPSAWKMFGYQDAGDLVGHAIIEFVHPEDVERAMANFQRMLTTQVSQAESYRGVRADGSFIDIEVNGQFIRDENENPTHLLFMVRDISARKEAERRLHESREKYKTDLALLRAIFESPTDVIIFALDRNYCYTAFSQFHHDVMKMLWKADIHVGMNILDIITIPEDHEKAKMNFDRALAGEWFSITEQYGQKGSSSPFYQDIYSPVKDANDQIIGLSVYVVDITRQMHAMNELKNRENEILELNATLEEKIRIRTEELARTNQNLLREIEERKRAQNESNAAKLEAEDANKAKSEFLSRMSHELRTPMNSILGFAQLLELNDLSQKQQKCVERILQSGQHLLHLINEVLDISRIEAGKIALSPEPMHLGKIIREVIDSVNLTAVERNIRISLVATDMISCSIVADRQRFRQVLLNLLSNAIKYNNNGGSVSILCKSFKTSYPPAKGIRLSVSDTGPGMTPEQIGKLFNPFERIGAENSETEGTGLGLVVVKKLVNFMGGQISVESTPDKGSTFTIEIPCQVTGAATIEHETAVKPSMPGIAKDMRKGTILLIEDNVSNIELIQFMLASRRPNITLHSNVQGKKALPLARELSPDLILLDLNLPDLSGEEVLEQLSSDEPTRNIPVVIISANAMPHQISRMAKSGVKGYLTKPIELHSFLQVIDEWVKA